MHGLVVGVALEHHPPCGQRVQCLAELLDDALTTRRQRGPALLVELGRGHHEEGPAALAAQLAVAVVDDGLQGGDQQLVGGLVDGGVEMQCLPRRDRQGQLFDRVIYRVGLCGGIPWAGGSGLVRGRVGIGLSQGRSGRLELAAQHSQLGEQGRLGLAVLLCALFFEGHPHRQVVDGGLTVDDLGQELVYPGVVCDPVDGGLSRACRQGDPGGVKLHFGELVAALAHTARQQHRGEHWRDAPHSRAHDARNSTLCSS